MLSAHYHRHRSNGNAVAFTRERNEISNLQRCKKNAASSLILAFCIFSSRSIIMLTPEGILSQSLYLFISHDYPHTPSVYSSFYEFSGAVFNLDLFQGQGCEGCRAGIPPVNKIYYTFLFFLLSMSPLPPGKLFKTMMHVHAF